MTMVDYLVTLHVRSEYPMSNAVNAGPVPLLYARLYHHSVGDQVEKLPGGTIADQNAVLIQKMIEVFGKVEEEYKGSYVLDPDPTLSSPNGPVWNKLQPGVVWQLFQEVPSVPGRARVPNLAPVPYEPVFGGQKIQYFLGIRLREYAVTKYRDLQFRNDSSSAIALHVIFWSTRTRIHEDDVQIRVRTPQGTGGGGEQVRVVADQFLEVRWLRPIPQGSRVQLRIGYVGEPPVMASSRFVIDPSLEAEWKQGAFILDSEDVREAPFADQPKVAEVLSERAELVKLLCQKSRANCAAHAFFLDLDASSTEPNLPSQHAQAFLELSELLTNRTMARAAEHKAGGVLSAPEPPGFKLTEMKAAIDLIDQLLAKHFPDGQGGWSQDFVEDAFERFASGRLWLGKAGQKTHSTPWGVPNSANYLNFAELILSGIDAKAPNVGKLESLLNLFVRTAEAFLFIYAGTDRLWDHYSFSSFSEVRQAHLDSTKVKSVYSTYSSVDSLRARFAEVAYDAFQLEFGSGGSAFSFGGFL
ncbi:MAG: hypothetical protein RL885_21650 [Planctomycetota bacterium]